MSAGPLLGRSSDELVVERDFLLASIEDLEAERAAGTLGEEDYAEPAEPLRPPGRGGAAGDRGRRD